MSANTKTHTITLKINQSAQDTWPTFLPGPSCMDADPLLAIKRDSDTRKLTSAYTIKLPDQAPLSESYLRENGDYPTPFIKAEEQRRLPQGLSYAVGAQQGLAGHLTSRFSDLLVVLAERACEASFEYENKKLIFTFESSSQNVHCSFHPEMKERDPIAMTIKDTFMVNFNDELLPTGDIEITSKITLISPKSAETPQAREAEFQAEFLRICLLNPYFLHSGLNNQRKATAYEKENEKKPIFSEIQVSNIPRRPDEDRELMKLIFEIGYLFSTTADEKEKFTQTMIKAWNEPQKYFPALYAKAVHFTSRLSAKQREPAKTELHRLYSAALTTNQSVFPSNALALAKTQKIKRAVKIFGLCLGLSAVAVTAVFIPPLFAAIAGGAFLILAGATQTIDSKIQRSQRPHTALVLGAPASNLPAPERVGSVAEFT